MKIVFLYYICTNNNKDMNYKQVKEQIKDYSFTVEADNSNEESVFISQLFKGFYIEVLFEVEVIVSNYISSTYYTPEEGDLKTIVKGINNIDIILISSEELILTIEEYDELESLILNNI